MSSINWKRKSVTQKSYKNDMGISDEQKESSVFEIEVEDNSSTKRTVVIPQNLLDALHDSKQLSAYNAAADIRKFEIELFWKRATFFWAFITAIYTAYYNVLTKIYEYKCGNISKFSHGSIPLLVLSGLGLFFCFSWLLSSVGSKHWQENWEKHLDLLEDDVTGPLYKTYEAGKAYSESKITITAGWVVTACSYGLLLYEFANMILYHSKFKKCCTSAILIIAFSIIIAACMFSYSRIVIGNTSNSGKIVFQKKEYED